MAMRSPQPPRPEEELTLTELAPAQAISEARLGDPELTGVHARGLTLVDVEIVRGNLANVVAPELAIRRATLTGTRLTGIQWTRAKITDAVFRDCRIDLATFAGTTFERTTFEGCILTQADFGNALLRRLRFEHCDLTEAELDGVRIDGCELRSCTLDGASGLERLRGAAMPWPDVIANAAALAHALGIRVLADDER